MRQNYGQSYGDAYHGSGFNSSIVKFNYWIA